MYYNVIICVFCIYSVLFLHNSVFSNLNFYTQYYIFYTPPIHHEKYTLVFILEFLIFIPPSL
jgi:hypothetical protein